MSGMTLQQLERRRESVRKYRKTDKAQLKARLREATPQYKQVRYDRWLKSRFGSYAVTVRAIFARAQNNQCKICGVPEIKLNQRLHLDHNHSTGQMRGLLCKKCNSLLGFVNDNPIILKAALGYLEVTSLAAK